LVYEYFLFIKIRSNNKTVGDIVLKQRKRKKKNKKNLEMRLLDLPEELIVSIFRWLSFDDLSICCGVSKTFARLACDPILWRGRFEELNIDGVPSPRLWCSSASHDGKWYLYGGHTTNGNTNIISTVMNDFYEFDFETKSWTKIDHSMTAKTEHKTVVAQDKLWFVGGYNGQWYTNEVFEFNPKTKTTSLIETTGERFTFRSALTVVVWKDKLITFGGWNGFSRTWFNDLNIFDLNTKHWERIDVTGDPPSNRTSHTALVYNDCMYVFGGFSGTHYLNDLQEFNLETKTWTDISNQCIGKPPSPRSRFAAVIHRDCMYILGGWNRTEYFADLFCFNFVTKTWTEISNSHWQIPCISQCSYSVYKNRLYIFGGFCGKKRECVNSIYVCPLPIRRKISEIEDHINEEAGEEVLEPMKKRIKCSTMETSS